ncbi:helix-turn-helix domain-containing protein [Staphylococcus hominis]|uniref:XRE family transcriptional regulator n=1 Tax=Staphylococcus hominis TaxID=1290 RepID=A0A974KYN4_STAHO|nr:helix-turn-helix transcriptional regulator [Staphylococcus hominis]PTK30783.1 XRE family transcriptional regulator [Staphylococcus hominis]RIO57268.1 XRE family transcriptional regulator [Staphylococcus hominis]
MSVGTNIKDMRKMRGKTQVDLSIAAGLTSQIISNIERGYSQPNQTQLKAISKALNCKISDLVEDDEGVNVDYQKIMFSDKHAFDALPKEERQRILEVLQAQADFMIAQAKKDK